MGVPRHGETQAIDKYLLPDLWCFHIYSYHAVLELDGVIYSISPGTASVIPPGVQAVYRYAGSSEHVYFHFQPQPPLQSGESGAVLPTICPLGEHFSELDRRARRAVEFATSAPEYAQAALWSILCELSVAEGAATTHPTPVRHPVVEMAVRHIEQRLAGHITVEQLCREVGVSYGYLGRLFWTTLGCTILEHVRKRRAEHAEHLILSTMLPMKVIARAVGVSDLQQFNRMMHRVKGRSPREIRALGRSQVR